MAVVHGLGFGALFGEHPIGLGDHFVRSFRSVPAPGREVPDDGGVKITLDGTYPTANRYRVRVGQGGHWTACYSGISGAPGACAPATDGSLSFILPGGLALGSWDVDVTDLASGQREAMGGLLTVIRRNRRLKSFELARFFPAPVYAAARGVVEPSLDEVLD